MTKNPPIRPKNKITNNKDECGKRNPKGVPVETLMLEISISL